MSESTTIEGPAGDLAAPIKIALLHPTIAGPDARVAAATNAREFVRAYAETLAKIELLFPHYDLPRTGGDAADYQALVLRMACDRFRGFEVVDVNARRPYEHRRSNWVTLMMLLADVETVKRERSPRGCTDGQAIRALITRFADRWGASSPKPHTPKNWRTLKNWLGDARNPYKNPAVPLWRLAEDCDQLPLMIEVFGSGRRHEV